METFSALSVATALCQFLDFTTKIVSGAWTIYNADPGHDSEPNSHLRTITGNLTKLNDEIRESLHHPVGQPLSATNVSTLELGRKCNNLGDRLTRRTGPLAEATKPETRAWVSFVIALRTVWDAGKIEALNRDLQLFRQQIIRRGPKPLLTASFFFWNSGTEMQMSYEGLARSLLYQILVQVPELVPVLLSHRALDGILFGDYIFGKEDWTSGKQDWTWAWNELMGALKTLLVQITRTHKIVVFIDGMDEFRGESRELIDFVKKLAIPGVKACVSSRPWNQFRGAFEHGPHLRVELLTSSDIKQFVTTDLTKSAAFLDYEQSNPGYSARLIRDVCDKSDGVFLWVNLVTKSLIEGLSDGKKAVELQERLESLPTDLD
ncbi:hypothetical protein BU25DRAFT_477109 [Macroventuria anomochaeta]|uniref:Uncharacterized protein n=1 Tax=Macroventuria anomochaeta TaxID=301207 RepID=A0ACB6RRX9_9PLEO|nr:uncharacterized protein BU25DRAFT_477109 [Macroventuria anomochaeta]KAF2624027.1 hypothetical protein BU25DRAFT_477109 [Macroventuria anomochaeta]